MKEIRKNQYLKIMKGNICLANGCIAFLLWEWFSDCITCYINTWRISTTKEPWPVSGLSDPVTQMVVVHTILRSAALDDGKELKNFNLAIM